MEILEIEVDIIEYGLYLLLPLIGYAVIKTIRNGFLWFHEIIRSQKWWKHIVQAVHKKVDAIQADNPWKHVKEMLMKKRWERVSTQQREDGLQIRAKEFLKNFSEKFSKEQGKKSLKIASKEQGKESLETAFKEQEKESSANRWKGFLKKLWKKTLTVLSRQFSVGSILLLVSAACFLWKFDLDITGKGTVNGKVILGILPFLLYGLCNRYRALRFRVVSLVMDLLGLAAVLMLLEFLCTNQGDVSLLLRADGTLAIGLQNSALMALSWLGGYLVLEMYYMCKGGIWSLHEKKKHSNRVQFPKGYLGATLSFGLLLTGVMIVIIGVLVEHTGLQFEATSEEIAREYFTQPAHILNIYIMVFACGVVFFALGKGTGSVVAVFLVAFVYLSNFIKLEYHNTFFTWFDLLQIKEMVLMGKEFLTTQTVLIIVVSVVVLIALILVFRKPLGRFLRIRPRLCGVAAALACLLFFVNMIYQQQFKPMDIYPRTWENEEVNVEFNGLIVNMVYNLKTFGEIQMEKPADYSEKTAEALKKEFASLEVPQSDGVQPDVILILAESLFDLDDVEGVYLSQDIDATVDAYSAGTMISPRYGGYTSAMEFEALTGLSLAYMPNSLTPYTTYFNNKEEEFPCIVREFAKNDYRTIAMHPNLPDFYNRTTVYEEFGFDEYLAIEDFDNSPENYTDNGFYKDIPFSNKLIDIMNASTEPTFLFGISMEGHYVTVDKYADPLVKAFSDVLPSDRLNQIEQQATSYYYTDQMIANIISYMQTTSRPTLLYVYGDHLPPVEEFSELGFIHDKYGKYSTSLVMYSNYKTISTGTEYITPNQLAAQIMVDSGIRHSNYYDYIYSIREKYPVLHKEFVQVENNEELEDYYFLQYDILAGKKYLYERE